MTPDPTSHLRRFVNAPFSAVFTQPDTYPSDRWRVRGSGVHTAPDDAPTTAAVFAACDALGISLAMTFSGGPCSADAYPVRATFLDGGLAGQTGNYLCGERGIVVVGPRAVLLLALVLGLRVLPGWRGRHGLTGVTLDDLRDELRDELRRSVPRQAKHNLHGMPLSPFRTERMG